MPFHRYCADCGHWIDPLSLKVLQEGNRLFCDIRCHHHFYALPKKWNWFLPLYLILAIILLIAGCYKAFGQEVSMAKPIAFTGLFCESEGAAEYISEQQNEAQMRQVLALSPTCSFRPFLLLAHDTLRLKDGWFIYRVTVATQNGIAIGYLATTVALGQPI